jgi:ribosome biogenesis GTPase A
MMVVGYPNVGKSSVINALARRAGTHRTSRSRNLEIMPQRTHVTFPSLAGAKTGALPGVTRAVHAIRVSESPPVFLLDTPGVMVPMVNTVDIGLRLTLTGLRTRFLVVAVIVVCG